jgi:CRP-like cAMP-binding protein
MAIDFLVRPLLQVPIFRSLKPLQLTEIANRADHIVFQPGAYIVRSGEAADAAILVVSGDAMRVEGLERGEPATSVLPGSLLAEMAMLIETEHSATVLARTAVSALRISRSAMLRQMAEDRDLAHHFINYISGRLSRLAAELRQIDSLLAGPANAMPITSWPAQSMPYHLAPGSYH